MSNITRWTVFSRVDCSLCEQMLAELAELLGPQAQITVLDVDQDAANRSKYGFRVPVLLADGEFVCAYRLDQERVRGYL